MIKINLLSEGKRPVVARRARQTVGGQAEFGNAAMIGAIVLGLLVAFGWWFMLDREIKKKDQEIAVAQKEVDELAQVIKEVEEYKVKKAELERKINVINDLKANQRGPVRIMDDVSRALPELLWLSRMNVTASTIQLQGTAFNMSAVANFLDNLDKVEEFSEPILADATQRSAKRGSRNETYDFRLNVGYSFAAKKPADSIELGAAGDSPAGAVAKARAAQTANESGVE
jgi:type IV pilus assembly protein PilN